MTITQDYSCQGDHMKKIITAGCGIMVITLITYMSSLSSTRAMEGNESDSYEYEYYYNTSDDYKGDNMSDSIASVSTGSGVISPEGIDTDAASITVLVNKEYSLPSSYIPKELVIPDVRFFAAESEEKKYMRSEAASALEEMFAAAADSGETLYGVSAYRSYSRQSEIYNKNIRQRGSAATNKVSAIPGHSEHQTGLAIDISCKELNGSLSEKFAYTSEGQWVSDNSYKYGFIVRYPKDKEHITGYTYEPWHIRYVGTDLATYLHDNDYTLEEYFNYNPGFDLNSDIISDAATAEVVTSYTTPAPAQATKATSAPKPKKAKKQTNKDNDKVSQIAEDNKDDNTTDDNNTVNTATSTPDVTSSETPQPQATAAPTEVIATPQPVESIPSDAPADTETSADVPTQDADSAPEY